MAKLQVATELLLDSLFKGEAPGLRLLGATVDPITHTVELDIEGPGIPHSERIAAVFTKERLTVRFEPKA